jgi:hypothetical protein
LIETEKQRRWWFATHPEYSRHSAKHSNGNTGDNGFDWERFQRAIERDKRGLDQDPHTLLDVLPYRRFITSPVQSFRSWLRGITENSVLRAAGKRRSKGPATWEEVCRSRTGLEHQSSMSGQLVRERGGKNYIKEYRVQTDQGSVYFDDFRNGKLYEYKGKYGSLINKKKDEFYDWVKGVKSARDQAWRQLRAAQGIPVIWRVGADQVKAFAKALRGIADIIIEP